MTTPETPLPGTTPPNVNEPDLERWLAGLGFANAAEDKGGGSPGWIRGGLIVFLANGDAITLVGHAPADTWIVRLDAVPRALLAAVLAAAGVEGADDTASAAVARCRELAEYWRRKSGQHGDMQMVEYARALDDAIYGRQAEAI